MMMKIHASHFSFRPTFAAGGERRCQMEPWRARWCGWRL